MRTGWITAAFLLMLGSGCGSPPRPSPGATDAVPQHAATLYRRLGGYDPIAALIDDFLGRMMGDPELAGFFEPLSPPEKQRVRQMLVDQVCQVTGGPCLYVGQDMRTAHQGLGITEEDWDRAVGHLLASLGHFGVPPRERDELVAIVASLKEEIVLP